MVGLCPQSRNVKKFSSWSQLPPRHWLPRVFGGFISLVEPFSRANSAKSCLITDSPCDKELGGGGRGFGSAGDLGHCGTGRRGETAASNGRMECNPQVVTMVVEMQLFVWRLHVRDIGNHCAGRAASRPACAGKTKSHLAANLAIATKKNTGASGFAGIENP